MSTSLGRILGMPAFCAEDSCSSLWIPHNLHLLRCASRYYPGEWGNARCRQYYHDSPHGGKRDTFDVICRSTTPSFRFFFIERFGGQSEEWYAAKIRYSKSVAVSSIVGHILGIGDRHTNNILVSQLTGKSQPQGTNCTSF
jgi:phosphatidylinositol kinase/protein kinase (PI-3  family)